MCDVSINGFLRTNNLDTLLTAIVAGVVLTDIIAAPIASDMSALCTVLAGVAPWLFNIKAV